jgi:hypothetical protein
MNPIVVIFIFFLIVPIYFILLIADGRKLRRRLREAQRASAGETQESEELFMVSDYANWTAPPFRKVELAGGGNGRSYAPGIERPSAE